MGYKLEGSWVSGFAYDLHSLESEYLGQDEQGNDRYNTIRSEMGELIYQLKYQHDFSVVDNIIDLIKSIKNIQIMDIIVPIPPSNKNRGNQPVYAIATELGKCLNIPVDIDLLDKSNVSQELKNITNPEKRKDALRNSMNVTKACNLSGKKVLLIDDLYRSGATLNVATELLYSKTNAEGVYVLTMTKTRSNR